MDGVDKERVKQVVYEMSKDSPHFAEEQRKQACPVTHPHACDPAVYTCKVMPQLYVHLPWLVTHRQRSRGSCTPQTGATRGQTLSHVGSNRIQTRS